MANARACHLLKLVAAIKICRVTQHTNGYAAFQFYDLIVTSYRQALISNKHRH